MKKITLHREREQGQAILLIAVLMMALIAILGLAIDGGGMFLLYRDIQNATDAAGLAAAYDLCSGGSAEDSAERSAELNGFDPDVNPEVSVDIEHPVYSRTDLSGEPEEYVLITISAEKPSYFIQVVYSGPLRVSATTLVRCQPGIVFPFPSNSALVALSDSCSASDPAIDFQGTSYTGILNSTIYSNCTGANSINFTAPTGIANGTVCTPGTYTGSISQVNSYLLEGTDCPYDQLTPEEQADPLGLDHLNSMELCGSGGLNLSGDPVDGIDTGKTVAQGAIIDTNTTPENDADTSTWEQYYPGNYTEIDIEAGQYAFLNPGVYCISGNVDVDGGLYGDGVFIYHSCANVSPNSNCTFRLDVDSDTRLNPPANGDYEGLLTFSRSTHRGSDNAFNNQERMDIFGTIYMPAASCSLDGDGAASHIYAQFICWDLYNGGNNETIFQHDPAATYQRPARYGIEE